MVIGILAAAGAYRVEGTNPWIGPVAAAGMLLWPSYLEEVLTRALIFRITEEGLGSWIALALSSVFFGFAHKWNPGASTISSVAIAVEAGILLGAGYMFTRRLWFVSGLHFAWNFVQGGVFGAPVSGMELKGWLQGKLIGPDWLTGGKFGPEASLVTLLLCSLAGLAILSAAVCRGQVKPPFWARPKPSLLWLDEIDLIRVESNPTPLPDEAE